MEAAAADDDVAVDAVEAVLSTVELLENILQFVTGPRNIVRTSQVCRLWRLCLQRLERRAVLLGPWPQLLVAEKADDREQCTPSALLGPAKPASAYPDVAGVEDHQALVPTANRWLAGLACVPEAVLITHSSPMLQTSPGFELLREHLPLGCHLLTVAGEGLLAKTHTTLSQSLLLQVVPRILPEPGAEADAREVLEPDTDASAAGRPGSAPQLRRRSRRGGAPTRDPQAAGRIPHPSLHAASHNVRKMLSMSRPQLRQALAGSPAAAPPALLIVLAAVDAPDLRSLLGKAAEAFDHKTAVVGGKSADNVALDRDSESDLVTLAFLHPGATAAARHRPHSVGQAPFVLPPGSGSPRLALCFSCVGRLNTRYGKSDGDPLRALSPSLPLIGFFGMGEFGPPVLQPAEALSGPDAPSEAAPDGAAASPKNSSHTAPAASVALCPSTPLFFTAVDCVFAWK